MLCPRRFLERIALIYPPADGRVTLIEGVSRVRVKLVFFLRGVDSVPMSKNPLTYH